MTSSFWLDKLNTWFVIVFAVTEVLDSHQHPARLSFHLLWDSISIGRIYIVLYGVVPLLACTIVSSNCYFVICWRARFIWHHQHPVSVCKLVSANYCFQVLWKFPEDRWKIVEDSFHAKKPTCASQCRAIAVDVGWDAVGVDEHIGSFQYAMA